MSHLIASQLPESRFPGRGRWWGDGAGGFGDVGPVGTGGEDVWNYGLGAGLGASVAGLGPPTGSGDCWSTSSGDGGGDVAELQEGVVCVL